MATEKPSTIPVPADIVARSTAASLERSRRVMRETAHMVDVLARWKPLARQEGRVIEVMEVAGEWYVRISTDGQDDRIRTYQRRARALAYAERQRRQLGIKKVDFL